MAAVVIGVLDRFVVRLARRCRWRRVGQVILVLTTACAFSLSYRLDEEAAFRRALGVFPPPGVKQLTVDRDVTYIMPNIELIFLRFTADEATIRAIVVQRGFARDDKAIEAWRQHGEDWLSLWEGVFHGYASHGGREWEAPEPMRQPVIYRWSCNKDLPEHTRLLWDADSGRAYVSHSSG